MGDFLGAEVVCTDPTGGNVNMGTPDGSGLGLTTVIEKATSDPSTLPFNLQVKVEIKGRIGSYEVICLYTIFQIL